MKVRANDALGPAGRLALVQAIESGMTQKAAAAAFCVIPDSIACTSASRPAGPRASLARTFIRASSR